MTCLTSVFVRVVPAQRHHCPIDWNARRNVLFRTQSHWRWLLLSPCMPLIAIQRDNHHETMPELDINMPLSHTGNAESSIEVASRHNGTASNILKSGKLRSLFQWSSRVTRAPPRSPGPPASGKGSFGKGKPEDDSHAAGGTSSNPRRDSSSSSSSSSSSDSSYSSRGSHSSGRSHHSDDHDHGVDWDW